MGGVAESHYKMADVQKWGELLLPSLLIISHIKNVDVHRVCFHLVSSSMYLCLDSLGCMVHFLMGRIVI